MKKKLVTVPTLIIAVASVRPKTILNISVERIFSEILTLTYFDDIITAI
jgi:hypothetical protein